MAVLAALALVSLVVWLYLVAAHGWFWRTDQRLPAGAERWRPGAGGRWPSVVAIVPARDEATVLPWTLPTLLGQDYPGDLRVVLVDDRSADGTGEVARGLAAAAPRRLEVVRGSEPPDGWAGKVWAMAQGAGAAGASAIAGGPPGASAIAGGPPGASDASGVSGASGLSEASGIPAAPGAPGAPEYLWFTDADVAHAPGTLAALVGAAEADRRDLVSQMALLRARTGWERVVVPAFVYLFAMLYPFRRVNRPGSRTAAAAGGCMLVRRQALEAAGGLARIRQERIDDVALARLLKRRPGGGRVWLGVATGVTSRRPYPRLADLWSMIARSAYTQLRYSPALLAATVAGLLLVYAVPPVAAAAGAAAITLPRPPAAATLAASTGLAAWALMAASYLPMLRLYRLSPLRCPSLPLIALLYAAITVDSARRHHSGRPATWKGRPVRNPAA